LIDVGGPATKTSFRFFLDLILGECLPNIHKARFGVGLVQRPLARRVVLIPYQKIVLVYA
jgi:hypothetical protein